MQHNRQQVLQQQAGQNLRLLLYKAQQGMAQGDIQQLLGAGGVQRQLAQQTLDAAKTISITTSNLNRSKEQNFYQTFIRSRTKIAINELQQQRSSQVRVH